MPTESLFNCGGFFGKLLPPGNAEANDELHNLYKEIPCLGVAAEAVQYAVNQAPSGPYDTVVTYEGRQPDAILLGFKPLGVRKESTKQFAYDSNIDEEDFRYRQGFQ